MLRLAIPIPPIHNSQMGEGRLIRVSRYRGDPTAKSYLVALSDKGQAMNLIAAKVAQPTDEIEDLGPVTDNLIAAMSLVRGEFKALDAVRHGQPDPGPIK